MPPKTGRLPGTKAERTHVALERETYLSTVELARRALKRGDITAAEYEQVIMVAELHSTARLAV